MTRPTKIDKLTPEQTAAMPGFAQTWIERGWRTGPLAPAEWAVWEAGARKCYEYAGIEWPGVVVRVSSPLVGALAAPLAAVTIARLRKCDAVTGAVSGAVRGAVDGAVHDAVHDAVHGAVRDAMRGAVQGAVRGAVDGAVHGAVRDAVRGAVDDAVDDAVRDAVVVVDGAETKAIQQLWHHRFGGIHWAGWWQSYIAFFRDVTDLQLPGDLWDRSRAYDDAQSAGWWWPFKDSVIVCDAPTVLHLEQVRPTGWGSHRLHCETGPAVAWTDGWGVWAWHGTRVDPWVIDGTATVDRILKERNTEVRRCAIESYGWARFVADAGLSQVGKTVADPGNPGQTVSLYDVPEQIYSEPIRVLICSNATPEADGTRRQFGITTPATVPDPVAAAAWSFGLTPTQYQQMERAT